MLNMKTPGAVLLLLWSGLVVVAAESGRTNLQDEATVAATTQEKSKPDIHTALREMSALMVEQRVELRHTKTQMETRLRASESKAETLETRLRVSEKTVEEQRVDLRQTDARLTASERLVERLQSENEGKNLGLCSQINLFACQMEVQLKAIIYMFFSSFSSLSLSISLCVLFPKFPSGLIKYPSIYLSIFSSDSESEPHSESGGGAEEGERGEEGVFFCLTGNT